MCVYLSIVCLMSLLIISVAVDGTLSSAVDGQALFIRNEEILGPSHSRTARQDASKMEGTVHNILQWLQQQYSSSSKKNNINSSRTARQQEPSREYLPSLPVSTTQRPRPFQTSAPAVSELPDSPSSVNPSETGYDSSISGYPQQNPPKPPFSLEGNEPSSTFEPTTVSSSSLESQFTGYPGGPPYLPPINEVQENSPAQPTGAGDEISGGSALQAAGIGSTSGSATVGSSDGSSADNSLSSNTGGSDSDKESGEIAYNIGPTEGSNTASPSSSFTPGFTNNEVDTDESHPPHVHSLNVECSKDSMKIDIEFNRPYNGIIYSKGHYASSECRYVAPDSGQTKYKFTVMLNMCGTQFIDNFSEEKQAYLENVLVLQNEPGFQEVWDSIRSVRCLWEGNVNKMVSVGLNVDALNHELVTFNGDTATAKMDIQVGRGPFAPTANGLVKIGETMTLVVTVDGDPDFNVLVRDCSARDNNPESGNIIKLTDEEGCVLKQKLIGAFQTTRNPDTKSVIAYAFFQAFKFPDVMDLTIECNVELCKANCHPCSKPDQKTDPGRRRRRDISNSTVLAADPILLGSKFRVYLPEEIEAPPSSASVFINVGSMPDYEFNSVCLSLEVFVATFSLILGIMAISSLTAISFWFKLRRYPIMKT